MPIIFHQLTMNGRLGCMDLIYPHAFRSIYLLRFLEEILSCLLFANTNMGQHPARFHPTHIRTLSPKECFHDWSNGDLLGMNFGQWFVFLSQETTPGLSKWPLPMGCTRTHRKFLGLCIFKTRSGLRIYRFFCERAGLGYDLLDGLDQAWTSSPSTKWARLKQELVLSDLVWTY